LLNISAAVAMRKKAPRPKYLPSSRKRAKKTGPAEIFQGSTMKIDTYPTDAVFLRPKSDSVTGAPKTSTEEDFAALMENANSAMKTVTTGLSEGNLSQSELNSSAQLLTQDSLAQLQLTRLKLGTETTKLTPEEAAKQVEETLSLLEDYAIALGDPATTLKDLAPLADELSLSADSLNSLSLGLNKDDPLKDISSETATIAAVEALKFKRGDFV
jgi:hypothetical protein